jgi:hypothetical protein
VRGSIVDLYLSEWVFNDIEPAVPLVYATVAISEVIKGQPVSRIDGRVEVQMTVIGEPERLLAQPLPTDEYLWFLLYTPTYRAELDEPPPTSEGDRLTYFRPNNHQAVLRIAGGVVDVMQVETLRQAYGRDSFPANVHGQPLDDVLGTIRTTIAEGDVAESDFFWSEASPPICPLYTDYATLREAVAGARLIVRGHPVAVRQDDSRFFPRSLITLALTEVLKGDPASRVPGRIETSSLGSHVDLLASMPSADTVLFLVDLSDESTEPMSVDERFIYFISTWHQSVYRDIAGLVSVPSISTIFDWEPDSFSLDWHGRPYVDLVDRIKHLGANGTGSAVQPMPPTAVEAPAC